MAGSQQFDNITTKNLEVLPGGVVKGLTSVVQLTQAEYDALSPVPTTLYLIVG